eukprot:6149804-Prymnesium_polylepis.1
MPRCAAAAPSLLHWKSPCLVTPTAARSQISGQQHKAYDRKIRAAAAVLETTDEAELFSHLPDHLQ